MPEAMIWVLAGLVECCAVCAAFLFEKWFRSLEQRVNQYGKEGVTCLHE